MPRTVQVVSDYRELERFSYRCWEAEMREGNLLGSRQWSESQSELSSACEAFHGKIPSSTGYGDNVGMGFNHRHYAGQVVRGIELRDTSNLGYEPTWGEV